MRLEISQLNKHFGPYHAVQNLDFSVEEGETVALLGRNGGKNNDNTDDFRTVKPGFWIYPLEWKTFFPKKCVIGLFTRGERALSKNERVGPADLLRSARRHEKKPCKDRSA